MAPLELLLYVFAGLVASWVYYGLVPATKPSAFNRVLDALVLTALIRLALQGLALVIPPLASVLGRIENLSSNPPPLADLTDSFAASLLVFGFSALFGLILAILTNKNFPHQWLIRWGWTGQAALQSNLSHAFSVRQDSYIVLNLRDGRRVFGWPLSWPDRTDDNYFLLSDYEWLPSRAGEGAADESGEEKSPDAAILIAGRDVEMVEFVPTQSTPKEQP